MKKTLHSALSLMMCLSLLITGLLPALAADGAYLPEEAPTQSYDAPAPLAAAPVTEQTFINEGGIKVVLKLSTGHFSGASFLCEVPDEIVITSTNGNISNVEFNVGEYDKSYKCVPAEAIQPASLSELNKTTVTATLPADTAEHVFIKITYGSGLSIQKNFYIGHMLGRRDSVDIPATCTKPSVQEMHYFCKVCDSMYYSYEKQDTKGEPLGHSFTEEFEIESTCNEDGTVIYEKCSRCGYIQLKEGSPSVNKEGHEFELHTEEATCYRDGVEYKKCSKCGVIDLDTVKSLTAAHDFPGLELGEYTTYTEPTCVGWGYYTRRCRNEGCNATDTYNVELPLGHNWVLDGDYTVAPSCDHEGEGNVKCTRCGATETGHKFPALAHDYQIQTTVEPTCTEKGKQEEVCVNCGAVKPDSKEIPRDALGHEQDPATVDNDCTTPVTCIRCGEITVEALEHNFETYQSDNDNHWRVCSNPGCSQIDEKSPHVRPDNVACDTPTKCTECGASLPRGTHNYGDYERDNNLYHKRTCKDCGYVLNQMHVYENDDDCTTALECTLCGNVARPAIAQHSFTPWVDNLDGSHTRKCTNMWCKVEETVEHSFGDTPKETVEKSALTCTTDGVYIDYYVCTAEGCNATKQVERTVPATGHQFGEWLTEEASTCEGDGREYHECSVCSTKEYRTDPADGHVWSEEYTIDKEATCAEEGSKSIRCKVCNTILKSEVIPVIPHTYSATPSRTIDPTCTDPGANIYLCTKCQTAEKFEEIPAKGHTYGDFSYNYDATCQKNGTMTHECSVCGALETVDDPEHPKAEHLFNDWQPYEGATIDKNATEISYCDYDCGTYKTREVPDSKLHSHTFTNYKIIKEATCLDNAVEQAACDICGTLSEEREVEGSALDHSEGIPTVKTPATCTADAVMQAECERCHITLREWTEEGTALGHSFTNYVYNNDATMDADGTETAVCDNGCGTKDTRPAPDTQLHGHSFTKYEIVKEATCTENAVEQARCDVCGEHSETREVKDSALGHSFTKYVYNNDATLESDGTETAVCDRGCGTKDTRTAEGTKLVEPGDVNTDVETEGGAPATTLPAADAKALEEEVLTEEDKAAVEKGEEVEIVLAVSGANETVSESDAKAAEEAAGDYTVAEYLDIELSKKVGDTETDIHELKNPITLVITVPEALRATGREFAVVRVHEGKASILSDLDSDPNTVTFKTDRFSTYALMYLDVTPSVVPWTHYHEAGAWGYNYIDHWKNCIHCGLALEYAPHSFVNGVCSVCGYNFNTGTVDVPTEDEGEQVEIEQPVEGRREESFIEE